MDKLSYEEILQRDGKYVFTPVGTSMLPLLRERRDTVLIERPDGRLNKDDVALYKRQSGEYVLHRVILVLDDGYAFCGDNQNRLEHGIKDENVIGVMRGFWREERYVPTDNRGYRFYTALWCHSSGVRKMLLFFARIFRAIKRRILKEK